MFGGGASLCSHSTRAFINIAAETTNKRCDEKTNAQTE